jgi:RNA polymerase sigma-70 factor (ECF subfamily)
LLPLAAGGDRAAIREIIERYGSLVWSLAQRSNLPDDHAEAVVHEIFVDLWRNAPRFDPETASEATFVAMIARRRLVDRRRTSTRRPQVEGFTDLVGATPPAELGSETVEAAKVLAELPIEERQALLMTASQTLSHEEVAHTTGTPVGTVKANARRGLLQIREALGAAPVSEADEARGRLVTLLADRALVGLGPSEDEELARLLVQYPEGAKLAHEIELAAAPVAIAAVSARGIYPLPDAILGRIEESAQDGMPTSVHRVPQAGAPFRGKTQLLLDDPDEKTTRRALPSDLVPSSKTGTHRRVPSARPSGPQLPHEESTLTDAKFETPRKAKEDDATEAAPVAPAQRAAPNDDTGATEPRRAAPPDGSKPSAQPASSGKQPATATAVEPVAAEDDPPTLNSDDTGAEVTTRAPSVVAPGIVATVPPIVLPKESVSRPSPPVATGPSAPEPRRAGATAPPPPNAGRAPLPPPPGIDHNEDLLKRTMQMPARPKRPSLAPPGLPKASTPSKIPIPPTDTGGARAHQGATAPPPAPLSPHASGAVPPRQGSAPSHPHLPAHHPVSPPTPQPGTVRPAMGSDPGLHLQRHPSQHAFQPIQLPAPPENTNLRRIAVAGWVAAGGALCLLLAVVVMYVRLQSTATSPAGEVAPPPPPPTVAPALSAVSPAADRDALIARAGTVRLDWTRTRDVSARQATGDVVWNFAEQRGFIRVRGLAPTDKRKTTYQLFISDSGRDDRFPVDGGLFDVEDDSTEIVLPFKPRLPITEATLFVVSLEKAGGVVVSSKARVVLTAKPN